MRVSEACLSRMSVRAFRPDPVPGELVREILDLAHRGAASGGNLQPWRIYALSGEPLAALKREIAEAPPQEPGYSAYPPNLWNPFRQRRFECGEDMYEALAIPREDKPARLRHVARNAEFFGAPVGLIYCIDRGLGLPQWADMGILMQTVMLLAVERGLDTCAQAFWASYPTSVARVIGLPEDQMVVAGMALGYRDPQHPINRFRTRREPFEAIVEMRGF